MKFYKINPNTDFHALCADIMPHKAGEAIMAKKSKIHFFYIKNISQAGANILKQDALSIGAELVCNKSVICSNISSNALLMGTKAQLITLSKKEAKQDFGLASLALFLSKQFIKPKKVKLMSIINLNEDSFYQTSRIQEKNLHETLLSHIKQGADFIDIGAVSSRPGSFYTGEKEELRRLDFALKLIKREELYKHTSFSLDSFAPEVVKRGLDAGFTLINDISALANTQLLSLAKSYNATYLLMHMQNLPHNMQENPSYEDLLFELSEFFRQKLEIINDFGVEKVVLDPGYGFGKTLEHNLAIINHLEHFLQFNKPILIGASRKSSISKIYPCEIKDRLAGSLALHDAAFKNGASIIRTHDLAAHKQFFALSEAIAEAGLC